MQLPCVMQYLLAMIYYLHYFFIVHRKWKNCTCIFIYFCSSFLLFTSCYLFFHMCVKQHMRCRSTSIISAWILLSKFPVQVCSALIRVARSLITSARNIFCCRVCSSTLCRAAWSNLFEVLNWFPHHFLRTFARVSDRSELWRGLTTVQLRPGNVDTTKDLVSFSFHILFYCATMQYERYEKLFAFQYRKFHKWNLILYGL